MIFPPRYQHLEAGRCPLDAPLIAEAEVGDLPPQGYRLRLGPDGVELEGADQAGLRYGRQTLDALRAAATGGGLPCGCLEDWPDFIHRGYMLDISRDRVPTMERLEGLIDGLAALRYNELQLYTEHTFAYRQHERVWQHASPLHGEEIRQLDALCRERGIELVPNQNSFGHMERWLRHPAYHHLAECPQGFEHPFGGWREHGSVLRPEPESLDFLHGLYTELLPHFSSRRFNVGGDEPWELGQGASRERVEREGKHAVYLDFLSQVCQLAEKHGTAPMCWADVLLESPESVAQLPAGITPILWGYEADHPFETQCQRLSGLQRPYYIAPGDSTWNSHTGRGGNMRANIDAAATVGRRYGAAGFLLTHWGDGGHPQPPALGLPALVRAGRVAWRVELAGTDQQPALRARLEQTGHPGELADLLVEASGLDEALDCPLPNKSFLAHSLHLDQAALQALQTRPDDRALRQQIEACDGLLSRCPPDDGWAGELALALRLNRFAAFRALGREVDCPDPASDLVADYRRLWLAGSRPGGLDDSLARQPGLL